MVRLPWQEANKFCQNLDFAGHNDWRLPTLEELADLSVKIQFINGLQSPHVPIKLYPTLYWSGTHCGENTHSYTWHVNVSTGGINYVYNILALSFVPVCGNVYVDLDLPNNHLIFEDLGNGTVKDNQTSLIWVKNIEKMFREGIFNA